MTEEMSYRVNEDLSLGKCRIEGKIKTFRYTWEIPNFWETYLLMFPIDIKLSKNQPFNFQLKLIGTEMDINNQKLEIYMLPTSNSFKYTYEVSLKHTFSDEKFLNPKVLNISNATKEIYSQSIMELAKDKLTYTPNNTLAISFLCKWCIEISQVAMCTTISQSYKQLQTNEDDIVFDKKSLLTFMIGDERLYANKNLICKKSAVFKAMFNSLTQENITSEIEITDIKYDILKHLLVYMHFNLLPEVNDTYTLSELLIAADKYDVQDLKLLCELYLIRLIDTKNCMEFLNKVWLDNTKYLKAYVQQFWHMKPKGRYNSELAKLINIDSESVLYAAIYTKTDPILYCHTETSSEIIPLSQESYTENKSNKNLCLTMNSPNNSLFGSSQFQSVRSNQTFGHLTMNSPNNSLFGSSQFQSVNSNQTFGQ